MTWDFSIWVVRSLAFGWVLHQLNCSEANLNLKLNLMFSCSATQKRSTKILPKDPNLIPIGAQKIRKKTLLTRS